MEKKRSESIDYAEIVICGACHSESLTLSHDFGEVPLAGYFPKPRDSLIPQLPMKLLFCENCTLYQISPNISDTYLFREYRYVSSIGMQSHFNELAEWFKNKQKPSSDSRIVELGCNDGPLLAALTALGFSPIGIDPATNIVELAKAKGLIVINDFFNGEAVTRYQELQNVDYIFSSNSFAHIADIYSIAESISRSLAPKGRFIVEVQSLIRLVESNSFDFVYHEHKYYYTIQSISKLMEQFGLYLIDCETTLVHGGSYRLVFGKTATQISNSAQELVDSEAKMNLGSMELGAAIGSYIKELKRLDNFLDKSTKQGKRIIAFGASGRANMLLGKLPETREIIEFVIDESPERIGRLMAQNGVKIVSYDEIDCEKYDIVLILAWNFANKIIKKWRNQKSIFVIPLPQLQVIENPYYTGI